MNINQLVKFAILGCALGAITSLSACGPKVDNGGYVREEHFNEKVVVGQSSKEDVRTNLGSPSSQSTFGDETWYYIAARKEAYAFMKPEIVQQDVTKITFDSTGHVSNIKNYSLKDGEEVDIARRTTPTEGHTMGFFEQVLGNIGRFNGPGGGGNPAAPARH